MQSSSGVMSCHLLLQVPETTQRIVGLASASAPAAAADGWLMTSLMRGPNPHSVVLDADSFKAGRKMEGATGTRQDTNAEASAGPQTFGLQCNR